MQVEVGLKGAPKVEAAVASGPMGRVTLTAPRSLVRFTAHRPGVTGRAAMTHVPTPSPRHGHKCEATSRRSYVTRSSTCANGHVRQTWGSASGAYRYEAGWSKLSAHQ